MPDRVIYDYVLPYNDKYAVIIIYLKTYGLSYCEYGDNVHYVNYICNNDDVITLHTGTNITIIDNNDYIEQLKYHISAYVLSMKMLGRYHDIITRVSFCNINNHGDIFNIYMVKQYNNRNIVTSQKFDVLNYVMVGSLLRKPYVNKYAIICGAGIIDKRATFTKPFKTLFVRGPRTRQRFIELGYECPEVYGDPALCISLYHTKPIEQTNMIGIIPHYVDYNAIVEKYNDYNIINFAINHNMIEQTTDMIRKCKIIISSSLHGIIVCHAYGIPVIWVNSLKGIAGDSIKFIDYTESVGLYDMQSYNIDDIMKLSYDEMMNIYQKHIPDRKLITNIQQNINNIMMNMLS